MISYKMFSRTCGNHRVGVLHGLCSNYPNEQFSDVQCTCVGKSSAQAAVTHIGTIVQHLYTTRDLKMLSEEVDEWHFSNFVDVGAEAS